MSIKFKLGLFLFLLGFLGVLTTLTIEIPLPVETKKMITELFTPWQLKLLSLINPTIYLLVGLFIGTFLYNKVNFKLPIIENIVYKHKIIEGYSVLKYGIIGGAICGMLINIVAIIFHPILPSEFIQIGEKFKPNIFSRFLYGGLTEEIIVRFGLMTFLVWLMFKIFKSLTPIIYWIGIIISSIIFGLGHLPLIYNLIGTPTMEVFLYIMFGNTIGGIIFGWLYWKKGLESAMIAHILSHLVMLIGEMIFKI